ncbi:hypothetical protein [Sphingomonas rosea]|uniref:hypothetical protein n=1 Tax=Sphingomonas rosea TaxID=335605 RepID=UPI0031E1C92D
MAGFSSFADSVAVGDSFYYSVQNADKPQEREVGRGTLLSNGTISRQPVQGGLISFTSGSKTIALVTTSEWYSQVQVAVAQGGGQSSDVDTRLQLKVADPAKSRSRHLLEPGRQGFFVWDATVPVATHQADTAEGIFVAPSATAAGAWVRQIDGPVNVCWFGASPAATASVNTTAFKAALAYLQAGNNQYSWLSMTHARRLYIPAGKFQLNDVLNVHVTLIIEGDGPRSTHLKWAAGSSGFRILRINTGEYTAPGPTGSGGAADETIIRGMMLEGGAVEFDYVNYTVGNEGEFHGIELRARASIYDVVLYKWQGDGIYSLAVAGGGTAEGNANLIRMFNVTAWSCRNGAFLDGADTNACAMYGFNGFSCRQWGFWDSSFLANEWSGVHVDGNGITNLTYAHASGRLYYVLYGQEAWCAANPPSGTTASNQGWAYLKDASIPALDWVSGRAYRAGGSFCCDNANAFSTVSGYSESGQPPAQVAYPTKVDGGFYAGVKQLSTTRSYGGMMVASGSGMLGVATTGDLKAGENVFLGGNLEFTKDTARGYTGPDLCGVFRQGGALQLFGPSSASFGLALYNGGNPGLTFGATGSTIADFWGDVNLRNAGKVFKVQGTQVVGPQGAAVADAPALTSVNGANAATAPTQAEFNALVAEFNKLRIDVGAARTALNASLSRLRTHGLIAAA